MSEEINYKVLWVEDDVEIVEGMQQDADIYGITLDHYTNWEDAEKALRKNFHDYSAIILDANCKIKAGSQEQEEFIHAVLPSLSRIFENKKHSIPWYILSAGTMDNFNYVVKSAKLTHNSKWGNMLYRKDAKEGEIESSDKLFDTIQRVAKETASPEYKLRCKFQEEFEAAKLIPNAENLLMRGLLPEVTDGFTEERVVESFNPMRMICEKIIDECQKREYIPYLSSLNSVCDFLNQKEVEGFKLSAPIMHKTLIRSLDYFLAITQDGSHDKSNLRLETIDYVRHRSNNNLSKSLLYIAMDLLLWYKELLDMNPNGHWSGSYESTGRACAVMNGEKVAYTVNGEYLLQYSEGLEDGVFVYIIKSIPNKFPFNNITKFVYKSNYKIRK